MAKEGNRGYNFLPAFPFQGRGVKIPRGPAAVIREESAN